MSQLGSQVAIISKKQYTGCVTVEAAYRINTFLASILHQIHNGKTFLRIVGSSYTVFRLIQHDIDLAFDLYRFVVEFYLILAGDFCTQFSNHYIIYFHSTGCDKFVSFTT